jgi:uncharacterized protein (TIGR03437 family)
VRPALFLLAAAALSAGEYTTYIGDQNAWSIAQVLTDASGNTYVAGSRTFNLSYDPLRPTPLSEAIVAKIDTSGKTLLFAGIGGKGSEAANAVALDPAGNIYIGGSTTSPNFPLRNALYTAPARGFLVKYNPAATDVLWATYFPDVVSALAADATGVYVSGMTTNSSFPTTPGLPTGPAGFRQYGAYLTKLTPAGDRVLYSTVVTGSDKPCGCCSSCFTSFRGAYAVGVGVDAAGNAYFGGNSDVVDLPTTAGVLMAKGAGAWVAKVNAAGTGLAYFTYLTSGGITVSPNFSPATSMSGFAVDAAGHVFVAGSTFDPHLPVTKGAFQTTFHGWTEITPGPGPTPPNDAFALELNSTGTAVVWGSYLGGDAYDVSTTAALDPSGNFWVVGTTRSTEFPNANGWSTGDDFIVGFNNTGGLTYSGRYPEGTVKTLAVDSAKLLHIGEPGGVLSAIVADPHPAVRPWFVGLYGGQIAPSEVISIYGPHLDGQRVTVDGIAAQILYTSDQQINLIVPAAIQGQTKATIRVGSGPDFNVAVLAAIPQIFAVVNQDGTVNSVENPAPVGSILSMWVTGFGAVSDPSSVYAGAVFANNQPVQELYSGAAPGLPMGVGQINFVAPNYWSIVLVAGGQASTPYPIFVR